MDLWKKMSNLSEIPSLVFLNINSVRIDNSLNWIKRIAYESMAMFNAEKEKENKNSMTMKIKK